LSGKYRSLKQKGVLAASEHNHLEYHLFLYSKKQFQLNTANEIHEKPIVASTNLTV